MPSFFYKGLSSTLLIIGTWYMFFRFSLGNDGKFFNPLVSICFFVIVWKCGGGLHPSLFIKIFEPPFRLFAFFTLNRLLGEIGKDVSWRKLRFMSILLYFIGSFIVLLGLMLIFSGGTMLVRVSVLILGWLLVLSDCIFLSWFCILGIRDLSIRYFSLWMVPLS